jgi:hypothetical protein
MHFIAFITGVAAVCAAYGFYRASKNTQRPISSLQESTDLPRHRPHLRPLPAGEFNRLAESSHAVLFHLMNDTQTSAKRKEDFGPTGISIAELQECLRWIPADEKILLVPDGGLTPAMESIIGNLNTYRDLYLLADADTNPTEVRN